MLTIEYLFDLDIKHKTSVQTPTVMRGDTAVFKFRVHDNSSNEPLKKFDSANATLVMPSGITITEDCIKENLDGIDLARFEFKKIHSIEVGLYQLYLTLIQGEDRVSVPPFAINIDDNVSKEDYEFLDIIAGLENQITELQEAINKGVALDSINVADGVAGLDSMKKIPKALLLDYFENHISTSMYRDGAHGFKLDENYKPMVLVNGQWKEAKYSDKPMGAGSPMPIPAIIVQNGYAIVSFANPVKLSLRKWTFGIQNTTWFKTNGTTVSTNTFPVSQIGDHTFYYKLEDGRDNTVVFKVSEKDLDTGMKKPIEEFNGGDIIKFGNLEWIVLDAKKGYLLSRSAVNRALFSYEPEEYFNPEITSNIAYWLNNDFLNNIPSSDRIKITSNTWNVGTEIQESEQQVIAKVGMLSYSESDTYANYIQGTLSNNSYFSLITQDSSSSGTSSPPVYKDVWFISMENDTVLKQPSSKLSMTNIRAAIYLEPYTLVEPITQDENVPLSQLANGDLVKFSDKRWRVLDKDAGYIIYDDIPIYRPAEGIFERFLNTTFYLGLSGQAKSFIQANDWDLSNSTETPMSNIVTANVGLLSLSMVNSYKTRLSYLIGSKMLWSSTKGQNNELQVAIDTTQNSFGNSIELNQNLDYQIVPVIKVSQSATFGKLKEQTAELSSIKKNERVWLGNYPWIKGNNNDLILDYDFDMDSEPRKVPFSGTDSSNYFSKTVDSNSIKNAGTEVNSKFAIEKLFYRVSKNLTDKEFNIGFASDPTSEKGFFKAGLVNTNTWRDDYQSNLTNLQVKEDFWLMNPLDADNAFYVSALDRQAKTASVTDIQKIAKPVLRLEPTTKVQQYIKDEKDFAYIPDPVVRGQLNLNLGKGSANNPDTSQITIEEMQSITFFDSLSLIEATDLTGLELLTNCTFIRMLHNPDKSFNITNFAPLIKLGESKTLNRINVYGVPEGDPSLSVYSQLKGKFPYINEGGVYTGAYLKVLISLAELKGIAEGIYLQLNSFYTSAHNTSEVYSGTKLSLVARSYGKSQITEFKPWNSSSFIVLENPSLELSLSDGGLENWDIIPSKDTDSDTKLYEMSFKDGEGNVETFYYKVDPYYNYFWSGRDKKPVLSKTRQSGQQQTSVTLPTTVDGLTIESFGTLLEYPFWSSNSVTSLTIPANYKKVGKVFASADNLATATILNDNIEFLDMKDSFQKTINGVDLTIKGRQNSTAYQLQQFKTSSENNVPQGVKNKYKFELLP